MAVRTGTTTAQYWRVIAVVPTWTCPQNVSYRAIIVLYFVCRLTSLRLLRWGSSRNGRSVCCVVCLILHWCQLYSRILLYQLLYFLQQFTRWLPLGLNFELLSYFCEHSTIVANINNEYLETRLVVTRSHSAVQLQLVCFDS